MTWRRRLSRGDGDGGHHHTVYNILEHSSLDQAKYDKKKEAVLEEMEIEASKLEKDIEDDFGEGKFSMVNM
jgi:hypothetical protein